MNHGQASLDLAYLSSVTRFQGVISSPHITADWTRALACTYVSFMRSQHCVLSSTMSVVTTVVVSKEASYGIMTTVLGIWLSEYRTPTSSSVIITSYTTSDISIIDLVAWSCSLRMVSMQMLCLPLLLKVRLGVDKA